MPVFYGSPLGAPPVAFRAVSATATEIVFTNPAHEFPQRICYARTAGGIEAEVSLLDGSKAMRWTFGAIGAPG